MDLYNKARLHTRSERAKTNSRIKNALRGTTPHTADLMFDLSRNNNKYRLDNSRRAYVKAIELVSDLLSRFSLPVRPTLEYRGLVKNSMDNGTISDGIVRVGAVISTLMGHRASIDIPVLIRDKKLLEPAVFFYGDAPYVMCAPAFEELIKLGTLEKAVQPRNMYQPPLPEVTDTHNLPQVPITNLQHMFSPGVRNPWTFRRHSQVDTNQDFSKLLNQFDSIHALVGDSSETFQDLLDFWESDQGINGYIRQAMEAQRQQNTDGIVKALGAMVENSGEQLRSMANQTGDANFIGEIEQFLNNASTLAGMQYTAQHKGKPRQRTNIDTPVEWPEIWKADIPDHMLDPAERSMEGLITAGDKVSLQKDTQVRERGGGHLVLPSGEQGVVLRDMEGDGLMLYVCFKEMGLTAMVPARMLKGASVSVDQVRHEVREMLREGYKTIDIKDAIQRRYPEQALEALVGLDK